MNVKFFLRSETLTLCGMSAFGRAFVHASASVSPRLVSSAASSEPSKVGRARTTAHARQAPRACSAQSLCDWRTTRGSEKAEASRRCIGARRHDAIEVARVRARRNQPCCDQQRALGRSESVVVNMPDSSACRECHCAPRCQPLAPSPAALRPKRRLIASRVAISLSSP